VGQSYVGVQGEKGGRFWKMSGKWNGTNSIWKRRGGFLERLMKERGNTSLGSSKQDKGGW